MTISIDYHDLVPLIQQNDSCMWNDLCLLMYFSVFVENLFGAKIGYCQLNVLPKKNFANANVVSEI